MSDIVIASIITSVGGFLGMVVALPNWKAIKNKMFRNNVENAVTKNPKISQNWHNVQKLKKQYLLRYIIVV